MDHMPILRLELDGVRHAMHVALSNHHREIEQTIEAQLKQVDIKQIVENEVRVNVGPILSAAVKVCIEQSIQSVLQDWQLRQRIADATTDAVIGSVLGSLKKDDAAKVSA